MVGFIADEVKFFKKKEVVEKPKEITDHTDTLKSYLPDFGKPWYKVPHLVHLNTLILIISLTSTNTGYDGSLLNAFQSIPDWMHAMGNPSGAVLGALANGVVFGVLISTFGLSAFIADRYGRRHAIAIGNIIMIVGTLLQSVAGCWKGVHQEASDPDRRAYAMFLVARIVLGVGNGIATVSSPPLIAELSYPSHRIATTAFYNSNWYLGAIVSAWVTYGTRTVGSNWSWRIPSILQGLFPAVQAILIYAVPESPRFLISRGRNDEARRVLLKYHGGSSEETGGALVDFEMSEIELAIEQERVANKFSYMSLLQTPGNRLRLYIIFIIALCMQLSGNGLVSYYLSKVLASIGIKSTSRQLVFNGGLMIYNYGISIIINCFAFQRVKRRTAFISSVAAMLLSYVIWTILSAINQKRDFKDTALGKGVMAMIFLYYLSYNFGFNGLPYLYMTEILPFTIRAKGINVSLLMQQLAQVYNGFVNPIAMDAIEWKYYIVYCCCLAVELTAVYLSFVETSGRTLEEVAEVFGESVNEYDVNHLKAKAEAVHIEDGDGSSSTSNEKAGKLLV